MIGYNLGLDFLKLHEQAFRGHSHSQQAHGSTISSMNGELKDISHLTKLLTEASPKGIATLSNYQNLIDRIKHNSKDILTDAGAYVWKTTDEIRAQLDLLRDKAQSLTQEINLKYTKMGQGEKDMSEITKIFFDIMKESNEFIKSIVARMR